MMDQKERKAIQGPKDLKVRQVHKVTKEWMEKRVKRVQKEIRDIQDLKEIEGQEVLKDQRVILVHKDLQVLRDPLERMLNAPNTQHTHLILIQVTHTPHIDEKRIEIDFLILA